MVLQWYNYCNLDRILEQMNRDMVDIRKNASRFNWIITKIRFKWTIRPGIVHRKLDADLVLINWTAGWWWWCEIRFTDHYRTRQTAYQGIRLSSCQNMTELHRRSSAGTDGSPPGISRSSAAGGGGGKGGLSQPAGCQSLLSFTILLLACVCGFSSRLFAVIRFESLIHEFDPWWGTFRPVRY